MENKTTITIKITGDAAEAFKEASKKIEEAINNGYAPPRGFNENDDSKYEYEITNSSPH